MTAYGIQAPGHAGLTLAPVAPSGTIGDTAPTGDHYGLLVQNQNPNPVSVVLPLTPTYDGLGIASRVVSVGGTAAAGSALGCFEIIPLPSAVYGVAPQAIQYSAAGSVNVAAVRIP
jgi:hypothetical protein